MQRSFVMNYVEQVLGTHCTIIFDLLQLKTSIDLFAPEKCKVTFGLKYIISTPILTE